MRTKISFPIIVYTVILIYYKNNKMHVLYVSKVVIIFQGPDGPPGDPGAEGQKGENAFISASLQLDMKGVIGPRGEIGR